MGISIEGLPISDEELIEFVRKRVQTELDNAPRIELAAVLSHLNGALRWFGEDAEKQRSQNLTAIPESKTL